MIKEIITDKDASSSVTFCRHFPDTISYCSNHSAKNLLFHFLNGLGPVWKVVCFALMGVDMPASAVTSILKDHGCFR